MKAIWLLAWALLRTVLRLVFRRRTSGIAAFRANYDAEGLPPVTPEERADLGSFGTCIACGLCDRGEAARIAASKGAYRGPMELVLAASRSMPDYRSAAHSFRHVPEEVLEEKERICPTHVPFRKIAAFVEAKAAAVGGPMTLPPPAPSAGAPKSGRKDETRASPSGAAV